MPQFEDVQVEGDFSVSGQVDLGTDPDSDARFSLGPDYVEFAGVPVLLKDGLALSIIDPPPAAVSDAVLVYPYRQANGTVKVAAVLPNGSRHDLF